MPGLREKINKYPVVAGASAVLLALIVFVIVHRSQTASSLQLGKAYFSNDDGQTYTVEAVPTSDQTGDKVQAMVFGCPDQKPFVGYLLRNGPHGAEVKKPGAGNPWIPVPAMGGPPPPGSDANAAQAPMRVEYDKITRVTCPSGGTAVLLTPDQ